MNESIPHEYPVDLPSIIEATRAKGGLIHDLPSTATIALAERHSLYTTTEERNPGSFDEFRRVWERERAYANIAANVGSILGRTRQYQEAIHEGVLGEQLIAAFSSIARIECDDIHLADSDRVTEEQKGIVTASVTRLTVPSAYDAHNAGVAIQGMLSTGSLEAFYPISVYTEGGNSPGVVEIGLLDEHAARSLSRSVEAVMAQQDKHRGVTLPPNKRSYADWKKRGETFPPFIDRRLGKAAIDYSSLELGGIYRNRPDLTPRPKPRIIGNDAAAFFEGVRDIFNGLIHDIRGGSHLNLEQHPIESARPLVERGIDLRRDKATLADVEDGPITGRAATITEKGIDEGREILEDARQHPLRTITRSASSILSLPGTLLDAAGSLAKHLPAGVEIGQDFAAARKEWIRRREAAAAGGERLDYLASRLRRRQEGLIIWE